LQGYRVRASTTWQAHLSLLLSIPIKEQRCHCKRAIRCSEKALSRTHMQHTLLHVYELRRPLFPISARKLTSSRRNALVQSDRYIQSQAGGFA